MEQQEIERLWEAFFAKYKKTEGDRSSWSALWTVFAGGSKVEMIMTRCPRGTRFRFFVGAVLVEEVEGFDGLAQRLPVWETQFPGIFDAEDFFAQMAEMVASPSGTEARPEARPRGARR